MSELACNFRSMSETLVAAASTVFLFMAANWGLTGFQDDFFGSAFWSSCVARGYGALGPLFVPFGAFILSVRNAALVSAVKEELKVSRVESSQQLVEKSKISTIKNWLVEKLDTHGTIAIMTLVPMYIRFPASALTSDELHNLTTSRGYARIEKGSRQSFLHSPGIYIMSEAELEAGTTRDGYTIISEQNEVKDKCPLELHPAANDAINSNAAAPATTADAEEVTITEVISEQNEVKLDKSAANHAIDSNAAAPATKDAEEVIILRLPKPEDSIQEREVLLRLGLAPTHDELSFLRSRNTIQTVLTGLQASGYMLTVIQRAAQNLGISSVEAFVTFLCITMCLQLLIEFYACGHFQRPLLLLLNAPQLRSLYDVAAPGPPTNSLTSPTTFFVSLPVGLLIEGLATYCFVHYMHTHLISSLSALLFVLAHTLVPVFLLPRTPLYSCSWWKHVIIASYLLMYAGSLIVALVSTIFDWKAFRETNQKAWYAWILPHVSS